MTIKESYKLLFYNVLKQLHSAGLEACVSQINLNPLSHLHSSCYTHYCQPQMRQNLILKGYK